MESVNLVCNFILDWSSIILFFAGIISLIFAFYGTTGLFSRRQNETFVILGGACLAACLTLALANRNMPAQTIAIIILAIVISFLSWQNTRNQKIPHWRGGIFLEMEDGTLIAPKKATMDMRAENEFILNSDAIVVGFLLPGANEMMMPKIKFLQKLAGDDEYEYVGVYWEQAETGVRIHFPKPLKNNELEQCNKWHLRLTSPFPFYGENKSVYDTDTHTASYMISIQ